METDENKGSYDMAPGLLSVKGHFLLDVDTWLEHGNTPFDKTTKVERVEAMLSDFTTEVGLKAFSNIRNKEAYLSESEREKIRSYLKSRLYRILSSRP